MTCAVLTFHHHTDDPVDGGRNIVERHTLVNPVTVSRDVVNNKGFAVNAHPYRKQQYAKRMVTLQYIGIPYVFNNGERKVLYKFMKMVKNDF